MEAALHSTSVERGRRWTVSLVWALGRGTEGIGVAGAGSSGHSDDRGPASADLGKNKSLG